jgi:ATP-dependent Clp protease ATP-binding subunit ClpA
MDKGIQLTLSEAVVNLLADKGYDNKMGARPLGRKIDELIRVPLSKRILFDRLENCTIRAIMNNDQVEFTSEDLAQPMVNDEGYIILDQSDPTI